LSHKGQFILSNFDTHSVFNQPPLYDRINLFESDPALKAALAAEGASWASTDLSTLGKQLGTNHEFHQGHLANKHLPELQSHDAQGFRNDQIEFHPAYHHFMALSKEAGIHCGAFDGMADDGREGGLGVGTSRAAKHYLVSQVEAGHVCPITMTHAAIPALKNEPSLAKVLLPKLLSKSYDPAFKPILEKTGITIGMGMTEKQGGTDVRSNTTSARALTSNDKDTPGGLPGKRYALTGHKWFMSAPMCDAFLVLAQTDERLSLFFVPRILDNGEINTLRFQRLKNKLGNKSNASSEVEFHEAEGILIGEEGRGIANIMTMANYTRLDCALGSAGLMRQALSRAVHHTSYRTVFQRKLIDQPMMQALLADMCLEVTAATHLAIRLAGAYERAPTDQAQADYVRLMTPVTKYWVSKRGPGLGYEAMECLGGNGYVEDQIMARIYRELPVNSIWEGSGSVMCLDLLRVMAREPNSLKAGLDWLADSTGQSDHYDTALTELTSVLSSPVPEHKGRWLCERLATLAAANLLMERSTPEIAKAYIATRLDPSGRFGAYGSLPDFVDARQIIAQSVVL
jgi:putative acyl-CoA dehydrogenase